jgi:hypothetical protein
MFFLLCFFNESLGLHFIWVLCEIKWGRPKDTEDRRTAFSFPTPKKPNDKSQIPNKSQ